MLFQTPEFALLLAATLVAFYITKGKTRLAVLSLASLVFYSFSGTIDTVVFMLVLLLTYFLTLRIQPGSSRSKTLLIIILSVLFLNLAVFKYGGFIYDNVNVLLGGLGLSFTLQRPGLWLPVGISFYTFQLAAYSIDVYKGHIKSSDNLIEFITYIMFFGQLIAGPIMRGQDFLPQLKERLGVEEGDLRFGVYLIFRGLIKKVVLADTLSALVDPRFLSWSQMNHASAWITVYLFAFQIYFDFSGYSDIGIGLGRLFGLKLTFNFASPYISTSPSEFWRRWHITLSSWLRDYLYIPLGGNRCSSRRRDVNLFLTMLLGGLWHGAAWTFVMWGAYQGVLLIGHKVWSRLFGRHLVKVPRPISALMHFHLVCIGWIFFRAPSLTSAFHILRQAVDVTQLSQWGSQATWLLLCLGFYALHYIEYYADQHMDQVRRLWAFAPAPIRGLVYAGAVLLLVLTIKPAQSFIYFRF